MKKNIALRNSIYSMIFIIFTKIFRFFTLTKNEIYKYMNILMANKSLKKNICNNMGVLMINMNKKGLFSFSNFK